MIGVLGCFDTVQARSILLRTLQETHMALPLVTLLIGAAAGAAITDVMMTRRSRNPVKDAAQELSDSVEAGAGRVTSAVSGAMEDATAAVKSAAKKVTK